MIPAPPLVELVTIGDELLLGATVDRNGAWLGRRFAENGIRVVRTTTVGDDVSAIRDAVAQALDRTGVVICTGGLGPTSDDRTRPAVADLFGRELVMDEEVLGHIRALFRIRGMEMPEVNRVQAEVPAGARVLPNPRGTAPGIALQDDRQRWAILLPGVPAEMHAIVEESVLPLLRERWPVRARPVRYRLLRTTGITESALAERVQAVVPGLAPLTVAFLPSTAGVDLRVTAWGDLEEAAAERALDDAEHALARPLTDVVYTRGEEDLAAVLLRALGNQGLTLSIAESCTGGLLAKRITDPAGASTVFLGGIVAYANDVKTKVLGVRLETLERYGAVSAETAGEMADGVRRLLGTDAALSVTGVAGPSGGTPQKPVGTVWIGGVLRNRVVTELHRLRGDRREIRERAAQAAFALLWRMLRDDGAFGAGGAPDFGTARA